MKFTLALVGLLAAATSVAQAQGGSGSSVGVTPNYKPGAGKPSSTKPHGKNIVVRPGGQGTNSRPDTKGKIEVAPTTGPAHPNKRTTSTTPAQNQ